MPKVIPVDSISVLYYEPIISNCLHQSLLIDVCKEENYLNVHGSKVKTIKSLSLLFDYIFTKVIKFYWDELNQNQSKLLQAERASKNFENLNKIHILNHIIKQIQIERVVEFDYQFFNNISKSKKILHLIKNKGYIFQIRTNQFLQYLNRSNFVREKVGLKVDTFIPDSTVPILSIGLDLSKKYYEVSFYNNWFSTYLFYRVINYITDRLKPKTKLTWKIPYYPIRLCKLNYYLIQILKIVNRRSKPYSKDKYFKLSNNFLAKRIFLVDNQKLNEQEKSKVLEKIRGLKRVYQDSKSQEILNPKDNSCKIKFSFSQIREYKPRRKLKLIVSKLD